MGAVAESVAAGFSPRHVTQAKACGYHIWYINITNFNSATASISTNSLDGEVLFHEIFHLLANDIKIKNKLTTSSAYKNLEKLILACQKNETDSACLKNIIQSYEKKLPPDIMPEKFCEHVMCDLFADYYSGKLTPEEDPVLYNHMKNIAAIIEEACGK